MLAINFFQFFFFGGGGGDKFESSVKIENTLSN